MITFEGAANPTVASKPANRGSIIPMATPNALFAIFGVSRPAALAEKLQNSPQWLSLKVGEGECLLMAPPATTSKEISDALGITSADPSISNAIVVRTESYFGRTATSTWEWITAKRGAELGTKTSA